MRLDHLPASVAFCDVETTGLGKHDRIVSFGGIGMISRKLVQGAGDLKYVYLVFDPGMGNCSGAARIHGGFDSAPAGSFHTPCRKGTALPDIP